jgi:hypothetical protein
LGRIAPKGPRGAWADGCAWPAGVWVLATALIALATMPALAGQTLAPREAFDVPLAKLSVASDDRGEALQVHVTREGADTYATITASGDESVRLTRKGRETTEYPESRSVAERLSTFEAAVLRDVSSSLVTTLNALGDDLAKGRWARARYLDGYLLRFLRGYQALCEVATCCQEALPRTARIPEAAFDVSTMSPKTDERVQMWQLTPDHVVKLRICAKTLASDLGQWIQTSQADPEEFFGDGLKRSYALFVNAYLGRQAPAERRVATKQDGSR